MSDCRICDTGMLRTLWYEITGYPAIDGASLCPDCAALLVELSKDDE